MLTKHIKIKQLNTVNKKSSSNNDLLVVETPITMTIENNDYKINCIAQFTEFLIQGFCFKHFKSLKKIQLNNHAFSPLPINDISIQPHLIVDWVRLFKDEQTLYRQTGCTESVGILDESGQIFAVECISFETAYLKLLGALIKKNMAFFPVLFVSHRIALNQAIMIQTLPIDMIICQSAITDQALEQFITSEQTVFGFCRKSKFNRYSNFHL